jgi:hypothetical protein
MIFNKLFHNFPHQVEHLALFLRKRRNKLQFTLIAYYAPLVVWWSWTLFSIGHSLIIRIVSLERWNDLFEKNI